MSSDVAYALAYVGLLGLPACRFYVKFLRKGRGLESEQLMEAWVKLQNFRSKRKQT